MPDTDDDGPWSQNTSGNTSLSLSACAVQSDPGIEAKGAHLPIKETWQGSPNPWLHLSKNIKEGSIIQPPSNAS